MTSFALSSKGQIYNTDSLLQVIRTSKEVPTRLEAAAYYSTRYSSQSSDSIYYAGEQLLKIGQKMNFIDMQAYGKTFTSFSYLWNL